MADANDVVVTGLGVVSPIGIGKQAFWPALCAGESGIKPDIELGSRLSARIVDFSARDFILSPHLRRADDLSRLIAAAARMAVGDGGLDLLTVAAQRIGIVVGSAIGDVGDSVLYLEKLFSKGPALASPMLFPNLVLNAPASYVAMELGASGCNFTVGDGEACGEQAIALAFDTIRSGRADVVVAGGGDDFLAPVVVQTYAQMHALAGQRGGARWCSPYDRERCGIVLGQGAAMLLLEARAHAERRGRRAYATLHDCVHFSLPAPAFDWPCEPSAAAIVGDGIDLMIGSANASPRLDACELALAERLPRGSDGLWLSSIKGAIGEFGAAGALAAVAACLAVDEGRVPPLCHLRQADTSGALRFAAPTSSSAHLERVLSLGLARGGSAIALLFGPGESGA